MDDDSGINFKSAYLTNVMRDAGVVERYEPVIVEAKDVLPRWMEYIKGKGDFDPAVVSFVSDNPEYAYDIKHVIDTVKAAYPENYSVKISKNPLVTSARDVGVIAFPNYRTWEFVSDHLKAVRAKKTLFDEILVEGFIGKGLASEAFIKHVRATVSEATEKPSGKDFLTESLDSGMKSGTPMCLVGMTSIGKTSRVKKIAKENNAITVTVSCELLHHVEAWI